MDAGHTQSLHVIFESVDQALSFRRFRPNPMDIDPSLPQTFSQFAGVLLKVADIVKLKLQLAKRQPGKTRFGLEV